MYFNELLISNCQQAISLKMIYKICIDSIFIKIFTLYQ